MSNQASSFRPQTEPRRRPSITVVTAPLSHQYSDQNSSRSYEASDSPLETSNHSSQTFSPINSPEKVLKVLSSLTDSPVTFRSKSDPSSTTLPPKEKGEIDLLQPSQKSLSSPQRKSRSPKNRKTYPSLSRESSRPGLVSKPSKFFHPSEQVDTPTRLILKGPSNFAEAVEIDRRASKEFEPKSELYELLNFAKANNPSKKAEPGLFGTFSVKDFKEYMKHKTAK